MTEFNRHLYIKHRSKWSAKIHLYFIYIPSAINIIKFSFLIYNRDWGVTIGGIAYIQTTGIKLLQSLQCIKVSK